jgi:hypothetical protein
LLSAHPATINNASGNFKIKRPFSLKIDIDQKEWPRLVFGEQLGCLARPGLSSK